MKKQLLIFGCLTTTLLYGTEAPTGIYSYSTMINNTVINLTKGPISSINDKVSIVCVGKNQQQKLRSYNFKNIHNSSHDRSHTLYEKDKQDESASDDDTYKLFTYSPENSKKLIHPPHIIKMNNVVINIDEPCIVKETYWDEKDSEVILNGFSYQYPKTKDSQPHTNTTTKIACYNITYREATAMTQALKCLGVSYDNALKTSKLMLNKKKIHNSSIALQNLSTETGIPRHKASPIAVKAIVEFIKNNPTDYNRIELFVSKHSEFQQYKTLLEQNRDNK